jgi:tetratricopeptide (TPR) repeat protein
LIERGFPQKAAELLSESQRDDEVMFWRAYALERTGKFSEAFDSIKNVSSSDNIKALKATLYFRFGKAKEANKLAQEAIKGDLWARAQAHSILADIAYQHKDYEKALGFCRRAVMLWQTQGNRSRAANSLNAIAVYLDSQGKPLEIVEAAYQEALDLASNDMRLKAIILGNLAILWERHDLIDKAIHSYQATIQSAQELQLADIAALSWNNLGTLHHRQNQKNQARQAYQKAIEFAQQTNEIKALGNTLANLAELDEDFDAWEEALKLLEGSGYYELAQGSRDGLSTEHPFRKRPS